jgi:AcrR family transcriptional regulator
MPVVSTNEEVAPKRRVPVQQRSRERVQRLLEAAGAVVADVGVEAVTTRSIAERAGIPVASLYQYFSDKEAVLLALVERDMAEMDKQVAEDLAAVSTYTLGGVIETAMRAFVKVYHRRPAFVEIWMRGRTNAAIHESGREHNKRIATELRAFIDGLGLIDRSAPAAVGELAVEIGDRAFQLAYETDIRGDQFLIEEAIAMVTGYLERYATPAGLTGVTA